jgi:hypothetical protein
MQNTQVAPVERKMFMKRMLLIAGLMITMPALASDVGISINVGEPGFYGQIDIGDYPRPELIFTRPVIIEHEPEYEHAGPIYLHVPPGYENHWERHCGEYHACGRQVFFVTHRWYNDIYVPHYREHNRMRGESRRQEGRDEYHDRGFHGEGRGRENH